MKLSTDVKMQETIVAEATPVSPQIVKASSNNLIFTSLPIALGIFGTLMLIWFLNSFLCICKPNEVVVLSGKTQN